MQSGSITALICVRSIYCTDIMLAVLHIYMYALNPSIIIDSLLIATNNHSSYQGLEINVPFGGNLTLCSSEFSIHYCFCGILPFPRKKCNRNIVLRRYVTLVVLTLHYFQGSGNFSTRFLEIIRVIIRLNSHYCFPYC